MGFEYIRILDGVSYHARCVFFFFLGGGGTIMCRIAA